MLLEVLETNPNFVKNIEPKIGVVGNYNAFQGTYSLSLSKLISTFSKLLANHMVKAIRFQQYVLYFVSFPLHGPPVKKITCTNWIV